MKLASHDFIFLDFQTTGTAAASSDVIEAGWGLYRADLDPLEHTWTTQLIALADERQLSRTIQRLTGLSANYYAEGESISAEELTSALREFLDEHKELPIVIHFAQFKLPFLWKVIAAEEGEERQLIIDRVICVHKLSKLLIPELKSFSLRAVAGYAGYATKEKKRSVDHLVATAFVWRYITGLLGLEELPENLVVYLKTLERREAKALPIHDQDLRKKRLALPNLPGVYFFLDYAGNILYVGKAANLKHRVNSYFRGKKTKGSRLNEMLTRAVDFRFVTVKSELEALLRENDEIKRHDPPYNRLLRVEGREVRFLRFNDHLAEPTLWGYRNWGPLSSLWMIDALRPFIEEYTPATVIPSYMNGVIEEMIAGAVLSVFKSYGVSLEHKPSPDDWHQLAQIVWPIEYERLLQLSLAEEEEEEEEAEEVIEEANEEEKLWTQEDLEVFIRHSFTHMLRQIFRSRWFLRLVHCRIEWKFVHDSANWHEFRVDRGHLLEEGAPSSGGELSYNERCAIFDMQIYDRIAILHSQLKIGLRRGDEIRLHLSSNTCWDQIKLKDFLRC